MCYLETTYCDNCTSVTTEWVQCPRKVVSDPDYVALRAPGSDGCHCDDDSAIQVTKTWDICMLGFLSTNKYNQWVCCQCNRRSLDRLSGFCARKGTFHDEATGARIPRTCHHPICWNCYFQGTLYFFVIFFSFPLPSAVSFYSSFPARSSCLIWSCMISVVCMIKREARRRLTMMQTWDPPRDFIANGHSMRIRLLVATSLNT